MLNLWEGGKRMNIQQVCVFVLEPNEAGASVLVIADAVIAHGMTVLDEHPTPKHRAAVCACDLGPKQGVFVGKVVDGHIHGTGFQYCGQIVEVDFDAVPIVDISTRRQEVAAECRKLAETPPFCDWESGRPAIIAEILKGDPADAQFLAVQNIREIRQMVKVVAELSMRSHAQSATNQKHRMGGFI